MSVSIVTTTIHKPVLIADYCENARRYDHSDVNFVIIGDKKTPLEVDDFCRSVSRTYGFDVQYYDVARQLDYLRRYPALSEHLPFNSIQRRNIGLLLAYEIGSDVIITIDDDNFVTENDFIGSHSIVGTVQERLYVASDSGWFNVCEMLVESEGRPFYHRGFPMSKRWLKQSVTKDRRSVRAAVNAGMWLNDPDIDAITRMDMPITAMSIRPEYLGGLALGTGTWSPFNSQNTALSRDVIPAYFLSPHVGRYDDIWASYLLRKIIDHLGDAVLYGPPLVTQHRNVHNLWKDLDAERKGMEITDRLVDTLSEIKLTSQSYVDCFPELTELLGNAIENSGAFNQDEINYVNLALRGTQVWASIFA